MKAKGMAKGGATGGEKWQTCRYDPRINSCCCQSKGLQARKGVG